MPADRPPLVTIRQAAAIAGLSVSDAYRRARSGNLPGLVSVPGHRQLIRRRVLEAWLEGRDVETQEPGPGALRVVGSQQ